MRGFRSLLVLLTSVLLIPPALAGQYVLQDAQADATGGGPATAAGPPPRTRPYLSDAAGRGGGIAVGSGAANCGGAITIKLTWVEDYPGEPLPKSVILKKYAFAKWNGVSGDCSNGLQSGKVPDGSGEVSEGYDYEVVPNPGQTISRSCTPTANASSPSSPPPPPAPPWPPVSVSVRFEMSATPVVLSLAGTIQDTVHRDNVLIGQRVIGSISASGYSLTNHQWAVSGPNWFHHVDWGPAGMGPKGPYYEYRHIWGPPTGWDAAPTVQAYYDEDGDAVFTCSADVWVGGTLIGRATAERELKVWAPQYGYEYSVGASQFSPSLSNADWIGAEGPGMFVEGWVKTPDLFVLQGTGQWSFAQRVDLDWSQSLFTSPFPNTLNTNGYQLDNSWTYPYPELPWDADTYFSIGLSGVSWEDTSDSPGWQVFSNASALDMTSHFEMFEVYVPPSHSGLGDDIEWVPLHMIEWFWILHTSRGWGDPWPAPAPGIGVNSSESLPGWKLQWNSVKVDPA